MIREQDGKVVVTVSKDIVDQGSGLAKANAIRKGLLLAQSHNIQCILVESDCQSVISVII